MIEHVAFINRESELALIESLIKKWDTIQLVCIDAPGGIGKTRLLQEVCMRYSLAESAHMMFTAVIDFDVRAQQATENIEIRIAQMLDAAIFAPFLQAIHDYRKMESAGVSHERLQEELSKCTQDFIACFNHLSDQKRVVMLFDTIEKIEQTDGWTELLESIRHLKNCVICMAGRTARNVGEKLSQTDFDYRIHILDLPPLDEKAGQTYLLEKQKLLHIDLEAELIQKLLLLVAGKPILIDLAVEWRARGISLDWLIKTPLEELAALSEEKMTARRQEFERQLVIHIAQTRSQMDWLFLLMSHVYPVDRDLVAAVRALPPEEAEKLFDKARTYVFVKSLPDGRITLHDEMRRMIQAYVWPEFDPDGYLRRQDSEAVAAYLEQKIPEVVAHIDELREQEHTSASSDDTQRALNVFVEHDALARELWSLQSEHLKHLLIVNVKQGITTFSHVFDEAPFAYRYLFRKMLLDQVDELLLPLTPEQRFCVEIRKAKYFHYSVHYDEALRVLWGIFDEAPWKTEAQVDPDRWIEKVRNHAMLQPDQQVEILIQSANIQIRLGKLLNGIQFFTEAVAISRKYTLKAWIVKAENGMGWAYRLTDDYKKAVQHYEEALDLAIELGGMKVQEFLLKNNLGFAYAYRVDIPGHRDRAVGFCHQALELAKELKDGKREGMAYSNLGCVTYMAGRFDEALEYFQHALDIFGKANDREWLSTVYSWRGAVYVAQKKYDLARDDLELSLSMNIQRDTPLNLSRLSYVYRSLGDTEKSAQAIKECRELALRLPDVLYQLVSLRDLAGLAHRKGEYHRHREIEQLLTEYYDKWGEAKDLRALGMLHLNLGKLALGEWLEQQRVESLAQPLSEESAELQAVIEHFAPGLQLITQEGRYANDIPYVIAQRLQQSLIDKGISPEHIRMIGVKLRDFWKQHDLPKDDIWWHLSKWAQYGKQ